jgi:hypothetical protein
LVRKINWLGRQDTDEKMFKNVADGTDEQKAVRFIDYEYY